VYNALAHNESQPFELIEWKMAEKFGWSLEYIESLPLSRIHEYLQIEDGWAKGMESLRKRNK